jgi:MFS family permease
MLHVLRQPKFALVWVGGLVSDVGDWLLIVGLPIYVLELTGSSLVTATVFIVELVPSLLLGSFAGVLVDRWDRQRTMVAVNLMQAVLLLPLLLVSSADRLWLVYLVAGVEASLALLFNPAKNALLPTLVGAEQLTFANSLIAINDNLARLLGSPLGGVVIDTIRLNGIVVVDAATYMAAAGLVALVRLPDGRRRAHPVSSGSTGVLREWREGLAVVRRSRKLSTLFVIAGLGSLAQGVFVVLFVVFVDRVLDGSGAEIGLLRGVQAIGGVLGGLAIGAFAGQLRPVSLIGWGAIGLALVELVIWNAATITTSVGLYVGLFIVVGVPAVAYMTGMVTWAQTHVGDMYLGRIFAAYTTVSGLLQSIGLAVGGVLGNRLGVVQVLNGQAVLYLLAGALTFALLPERRMPAASSPTASSPKPSSPKS